MSKSTDEPMVEELDNEDSLIGNDILSQELDEESVQELDESTVQEFEEKARFVSQREIISIVFLPRAFRSLFRSSLERCDMLVDISCLDANLISIPGCC